MNRKIFVALLILVLIAILTIFTFQSLQRKDDDIFVKIAIWRSSSPEHMSVPLVHYFVINDDRTFTSYFGTSRNHNDITRHNFMRSIQEKEVVVLDAQDFQSISELVSVVIAVENNSQQWNEVVLSDRMFATLYHNGNVYGHSTARSGYFQELINKAIQLSPLSIH